MGSSLQAPSEAQAQAQSLDRPAAQRLPARPAPCAGSGEGLCCTAARSGARLRAARPCSVQASRRRQSRRRPRDSDGGGAGQASGSPSLPGQDADQALCIERTITKASLSNGQDADQALCIERTITKASLRNGQDAELEKREMERQICMPFSKSKLEKRSGRAALCLRAARLPCPRVRRARQRKPFVRPPVRGCIPKALGPARPVAAPVRLGPAGRWRRHRWSGCEAGCRRVAASLQAPAPTPDTRAGSGGTTSDSERLGVGWRPPGEAASPARG
jgi:hypothetical protein